MKLLLLIVSLLGGLGRPAPADTSRAVASQAAYDARFAARQDSLVAALVDDALRKADLRRRLRSAGDTRPANVMTTPADRLDLLEAALLIRSGRDVEMGNTAIREEAEAPFRGGMFYIHDVMAAYLHAYDGLAPATRRAVRESLRRHPIYRGDTENHWLLYYTGLYLAAQTWPDEPAEAWFTGKPSSANLAEARDYLEHWMRLTVTQGQGEFDSPTYFITFVSPLLTLYTFAQDPVLKERARKMLDWIWADYAAEYLNGLYAGGHSRDYSYDATEPERAPAVGWGWYYFGASWPTYRSDNLLGAWSPYRLPYLIHNVAVDRSAPYVHRERKRVRHVIRYGAERNPPVYKTTFMTDAFALGSLQGGILQPIQQHTWDVTFDDPRPHSSVFTLHPYYAGEELAMFFPEEVEWLSDEVDRYHKVYTDPNKWNSASPYERVFQHENALIVLYDLAPEARHDHVDGFFPKTLRRREVDPSGWIFAQGGQAYIAVRPLQAGVWIEEDVAWRWRSHARRNGFVVEVARAADYASWEAFKARVRAAPLDTARFAAEARVAYTTTAGHHLAFTYPDDRRLDGRPVSFDGWPLFDGPYLQGSAGLLEVRHGGQLYRVDLTDLL